MIGVVVDITARKRLEEAQRAALLHFQAAAETVDAGLALLHAECQPSTNDLPRNQRPAAAPDLTGREHQLLILLVQGKSGKEIAHALNIAHSTARKNLTALYGKLGVHAHGEAVAWAWHNGVVDDEQR